MKNEIEITKRDYDIYHNLLTSDLFSKDQLEDLSFVNLVTRLTKEKILEIRKNYFEYQKKFYHGFFQSKDEKKERLEDVQRFIHFDPPSKKTKDEKILIGVIQNQKSWGTSGNYEKKNFHGNKNIKVVCKKTENEERNIFQVKEKVEKKEKIDLSNLENWKKISIDDEGSYNNITPLSIDDIRKKILDEISKEKKVNKRLFLYSIIEDIDRLSYIYKKVI